jgi:hypothetical protein
MPITYDPPGVYGGTETLGTLIQEVLSVLQGYTADSDQVTSLSAPIGATDTTFTVDDASGLSAGIVEIGDELVWVRSVDTASNTAQTLPSGRGWRGTQPTAHAAGELVSVSPTVPRSAIVREINNVIRALYPSIYGVGTTEFTYLNLLKVAWDIPAEVESVIDVRWRDPIGNWQPVRHWSVENSLDATDHTTGTALRVIGVPSGFKVQVVYGKRPTVLTSLTQEWTDCGLSGGSKDLLILGAIYRLLPALDVSRLSVSYAPADELDQPRPLGSALTVAKQYHQDYLARLAEERDALNRRYPARWHRIVR